VRRTANENKTPPLTRRVPGAARRAPGSANRPVLPEAILKQMQAAVDAARTRQDDPADTPPGATAPGRERTAEQAADTESLTEPLPHLQAAIAELTETGQTSRPAARGPGAKPDRGSKPERGSKPGRGSRRDSSSRPNGESLVDNDRQPAPARLSAPRLPVQIWPLVQGVQSAQTRLAEAAAQTSPSPRQPSVDRRPPDRTLSPGRTSTTASTVLPGSLRPPAGAGRFATGQTTAVPALPRPARRWARRGPRVATAAALAVIVIAAGGIAILLSSRTSGVSAHGGKSPRPPSPATAKLAASWVAGQVSHDAYVACDKAMCDLLTADQFPGRKLQVIRPDSPYPLHAQVVIVTPVVQRQFGSSLATNWAPIVLTRVGLGPTAISIRVVSPHGAAAYRSALSKDLQQRKNLANFLLASPQVTASVPVRKELADGQVDARLIVTLTALAAKHPIDILSLGTNFPGASAGVPLRVAQLASMDAASGLNRSDYLRFLRTVLYKQSDPYQPEAAGLTHDSSGKLIFQIKFAAPSQLLLLAG
jgi:hypothetical protein